jgi:hypothetical protein
MRFVFAFLTLPMLTSVAHAQVEAHLNRLERKTTWTFRATDNNYYSIDGDFAGVNGDAMQVRDADGIRHRIPIDELIEKDRLLFWEFRGDHPLVGMPGTHARRMENQDYADYESRLTERRVYANRIKAELAAQRGPARGWTAIRAPNMVNIMSPIVPLDRGVVTQPPIPYLGGRVHVRGYYRKDGTYVRPHTRRRPR